MHIAVVNILSVSTPVPVEVVVVTPVVVTVKPWWRPIHVVVEVVVVLLITTSWTVETLENWCQKQCSNQQIIGQGMIFIHIDLLILHQSYPLFC